MEILNLEFWVSEKAYSIEFPASIENKIAYLDIVVCSGNIVKGFEYIYKVKKFGKMINGSKS
jgi:hypothetical protein